MKSCSWFMADTTLVVGMPLMVTRTASVELAVAVAVALWLWLWLWVWVRG